MLVGRAAAAIRVYALFWGVSAKIGKSEHSYLYHWWAYIVVFEVTLLPDMG